MACRVATPGIASRRQGKLAGELWKILASTTGMTTCRMTESQTGREWKEDRAGNRIEPRMDIQRFVVHHPVASRDIFLQTLTCSRIHVLWKKAGSSFSAGGFLAQDFKMGNATDAKRELGAIASNGLLRCAGSRIAPGSEFFKSVDSSTRTQFEVEGRISWESC